MTLLTNLLSGRLDPFYYNTIRNIIMYISYRKGVSAKELLIKTYLDTYYTRVFRAEDQKYLYDTYINRGYLV